MPLCISLNAHFFPLLRWKFIRPIDRKWRRRIYNSFKASGEWNEPRKKIPQEKAPWKNDPRKKGPREKRKNFPRKNGPRKHDPCKPISSSLVYVGLWDKRWVSFGVCRVVEWDQLIKIKKRMLIGIPILLPHRFHKVLSLRKYVAWFWLPHRGSFVDT